MIQRLGAALRGFMAGRNGVDNLAWVLCIVALVMNLMGSFTELQVLGLLSNIPMFLALFRVFSRNVVRRREENQRFMQFFQRIKGRRTHCYFRCPACRTQVRVPKGKGKIKITCPACRETFIKKT